MCFCTSIPFKTGYCQRKEGSLAFRKSLLLLLEHSVPELPGLKILVMLCIPRPEEAYLQGYEKTIIIHLPSLVFWLLDIRYLYKVPVISFLSLKATINLFIHSLVRSFISSFVHPSIYTSLSLLYYLHTVRAGSSIEAN